MKNVFNLTSRVIITALLFCTVQFAFGQDFYLELQDIIHKPYQNYPDPIYVKADEYGGEIRFRITYYTSQGACPENFTFKWSFDQNMKILPGLNLKRKSYPFRIRAEKDRGNCGEVNPSRNPFASVSAIDGGGSYVFNGSKYGSEKSTKAIGRSMDQARLYFRNDAWAKKNNAALGQINGDITVYTMDSYDGFYAFFNLTVSGNSNRGGLPSEGIYSEVLYVYKIKKGKPDGVVESNPCQIEAPDCGAYPGTVPVWNFETNKGDCLCRKGLVWDDLKKRCVDNKSIVLPPDNPFVQLQQPPSYDIRNWKLDYGPYKINGTQIDANPSGDGKTSYYIGPAEFKGDWSGYSMLRFDKKSSGGSYYGPDSYGAKGDVIIKNGSLTARYDIAKHHNGNWKTFSIPLNGNGWTLGGGATRLGDVLQNVTEFRIRAEYGAGTDKSSLRNVSF